MVNSVNLSSMVRPGTFVSQRGQSIGSAVPVANHAVAYLFGTVENDTTDPDYSELVPYQPVQISSLNDYISKAGGVPIASAASRVTYDAVNAFFNNVGNQGILYFTRVTPTPEVILEVPTSVTTGYNLVSLKINDVEYGSVINSILDKTLIQSSGIDAPDVAYDIYTYLSNNQDFVSLYNVEEFSPEDAENRQVRITSKDTTVLVDVQEFKVYKSSDLSEINLINFVKKYYPSRDINFRLKTDITESIVYIDGEDLRAYNDALGVPYVLTGAGADAAGLDLLNEYLATVLEVAPVQGYHYPVSKSTDTDLNTVLGGWNTATTVVGTDITVLATDQTLPSETPNSIQIFYLEIAGESQAIIVNGATYEEFRAGLDAAITDILTANNLDKYYEVSSSIVEPDNANIALKPVLSPVLTEVLLDGTVALTGTALVGTNTTFLADLYPGLNVYLGTKRYTVVSVADDTNAVLAGDTGVANSATALYIDKSEATGFYTYDPVIKVNLKAKNGLVAPVKVGTNRGGVLDANVSITVALDEALTYTEDKFYEGNKVKAQDFVYAISQTFTGNIRLQPGFILAPEAYASIISIPGGVISATEARLERLKVTSAIATAAEGKIPNEYFDAAVQHVGLIDCGGDVTELSAARDELINLRSKVGSAYGHLAYYAPYVINTAGNEVPLSPYVAGIACSRFVNEGFQQPPAGTRYPLRDAVGLKFSINSQQQETTYALGLNPARELPSRGIVIWGSRTISGNSNFKYINTRVILNVLIDVLNRSFDDVLFEQIDSPNTVFSRVLSIATAVCNGFYRQGAFFGNKPEEAYSVICSLSNNTIDALDNGTVVCDIYVATSPTLERVLVSVARTPSGQVALINESFSRNAVRFENAQNNRNLL